MEVVMHYERGNLGDFMRGFGTGYLWSTAIHGSKYQGLGSLFLHISREIACNMLMPFVMTSGYYQH